MNHPAGTNNCDIVKSFLNKLGAWKRVSLVVLSYSHTFGLRALMRLYAMMSRRARRFARINFHLAGLRRRSRQRQDQSLIRREALFVKGHSNATLYNNVSIDGLLSELSITIDMANRRRDYALEDEYNGQISKWLHVYVTAARLRAITHYVNLLITLSGHEN